MSRVIVRRSVSGYDPKQFEQTWYASWLERGAFAPAPKRDGERTFSIVIPPPNVTGSLHMGHALNNTLQDILVRYHRMLGEAVVWVPGTDHAGIATQNVVERRLMAEGVAREDLGREEFVRRVWEWKAESGGRITEQLKRLGVSCDWSRERFTMDEGLSRAVREVFVTLYEAGRITRDRYLINWCPRCRTALSDIEVEHEERDGSLWHLRYPLENGAGEVVVATTRPETMLGDTAVAVHPDDARYASLVGKNVVLPVLGRRIPIVADTYVDSAFGSGAVKITPGHDPNDYEMGLRHALPIVSVMDEDAAMTAEAGEYAGLTREGCRQALVERFERDGTLLRVEPHRHAVGTCYRCHTVVEPMVSEQWFVEVKDMAAESLAAVDDGRTRFVPAHWEKTFRAWMENIRPWCISRQLWWGHRIPAWYCDDCPRTIVSRDDVSTCPGCGGAVRQDEDVLDTWFSSALWPFSTHGWPKQTEDLERFYPTTVLVTAFDIIFFWVARMMMMGLRFMGDVPFRDVYIHALVRDEHGQKMSKSKGNVIDPLEIVDEYGADAFRFTLAAFAAMGRDIRLAEERIAGYRNFVNKLWNAARYTSLKREGRRVGCAMPAAPRDVTARWIRSRLAHAVRDVRQALETYRFNDAASRLYQFVWHEFCDWYIELSKVVLERGDRDADEAVHMLTAGLEHALRMLHPITPFVTEEIWQSLPAEGRDAAGSIMLAAYPAVEESWIDEAADAEIAVLIEVVRAVRNVRSEMGIKPNVELEAYVSAGPIADVLARQADSVRRLARVSALHVGGRPPAGCAVTVAAGAEIAVPIVGHVDLAAETARLRKEIEKLDAEVARVDKKLANGGFVAKAPPELVEQERDKRGAFVAERETLQASLARINAIGGGS